MKPQVKAEWRRNRDTGEIISTTEWLARKQAIETAGGRFDPDSNSIIRNSLAARHECEFMEMVWAPERETEEVGVPVMLEIVESPRSDLPFVVPLRRLTGDLTNVICRYLRPQQAAAIVTRLFKEAGWTQVMEKPPVYGVPRGISGNAFWVNDNSLEFMRLFVSNKGNMETSYGTLSIPELDAFAKVTVQAGLFDELKTLSEADAKTVETCVKAYLAKNKAMAEINLNIGDVMSQLNAIKGWLNQVDPKAKTEKAMSQAKSRLNQLMETLRVAAADTQDSE